MIRPIEAYLGEPALPSAAEVGGKAAGLVWLARRGFQLPQTWIMAARPFRDLVRRRLGDGLEPAALLRAVGDRTALGRMGRARQIVLSEPLDACLREELGELWRQLGSQAPWGLAVRSSATCEDGQLTSMAGLATTVLGVRGHDALCDAVRQIWASALLPRALGHLAARGVRDVAMAVVIQAVVPADSSGVMVTRPGPGIDGRVWAADERMINATLGLGVPVVNGAAAPDTFRIAAASGAVRHRTIAVKTRALVVGEQGPAFVAVAPERVRTPALAEAALRRRAGADPGRGLRRRVRRAGWSDRARTGASGGRPRLPRRGRCPDAVVARQRGRGIARRGHPAHLVRGQRLLRARLPASVRVARLPRAAGRPAGRKRARALLPQHERVHAHRRAGARPRCAHADGSGRRGGRRAARRPPGHGVARGLLGAPSGHPGRAPGRAGHAGQARQRARRALLAALPGRARRRSGRAQRRRARRRAAAGARRSRRHGHADAGSGLGIARQSPLARRLPRVGAAGRSPAPGPGPDRRCRRPGERRARHGHRRAGSAGAHLSGPRRRAAPRPVRSARGSACGGGAPRSGAVPGALRRPGGARARAAHPALERGAEADLAHDRRGSAPARRPARAGPGPSPSARRRAHGPARHRARLAAGGAAAPARGPHAADRRAAGDHARLGHAPAWSHPASRVRDRSPPQARPSRARSGRRLFLHA
ncbi:MAG: hypothetical protein HY744_19155 [Deltaproteobacteria bacterium]|nr:hypothetical protein [Deltaproteobacteria bacterium]